MKHKLPLLDGCNRYHCGLAMLYSASGTGLIVRAGGRPRRCPPSGSAANGKGVVRRLHGDSRVRREQSFKLFNKYLCNALLAGAGAAGTLRSLMFVGGHAERPRLLSPSEPCHGCLKFSSDTSGGRINRSGTRSGTAKGQRQAEATGMRVLLHYPPCPIQAAQAPK